MLRCGGVKNRRILSDLDVKQHTAAQLGWNAELLLQVKLCVSVGGGTDVGGVAYTQGDDDK